MLTGICLIQLIITIVRSFMLTSNLNCSYQEVPKGAPNCLADLRTLDWYFICLFGCA
jgi:hypothetical protein